MFSSSTQFNYTLAGKSLPAPQIQDLPTVVGALIPAKTQFVLIWNGLSDDQYNALTAVEGQPVPLVCVLPANGDTFTVTVVPRLMRAASELVGGLGLDLVGTALVGTGTYYDVLAPKTAALAGGIGMNALGMLPLAEATILQPAPAITTTVLHLVTWADASVATPVIAAGFY